MLVLLIEDHRLLAQTLGDYLLSEAIEVDFAFNGTQGLKLATEQPYDVIILDINLPDIDGFNICHRLRREHGVDIPILMLTARDKLEDKLTGFDQGADDYLVKPFENKELVARLQALVKRYRGQMSHKEWQVGDLILNTAKKLAWREQQRLALSPTGLRILQILMREFPNVVTRKALEQELWGSALPDTDALRSHLYNLRKAVDYPFQQAMIQTVKGIGIRLVVVS